MNKRILIIDDDQYIRQLLTLGLGLHGFQCTTAENGVAAQLALQTEPYDVILVDLMMPLMDGLAFIHWLRETAQLGLPVLVLTSVHNLDVHQRVLAAGANGLVTKPIRIPQLLEELKTLLPE